MVKFTDFTESERIQLVKDRFVRIIEELVFDPKKLANYTQSKEVSQELYAKIERAISNVPKSKVCNCGTCIDLTIVNGTIAPELEVLIDVAREEAEKTSY
jgi:hypothetical protein